MKNQFKRQVTTLTLLCAATSPALALATESQATPADDLPKLIAALLPGDELVLGGGTYSISQRFSIGVKGTAAAPIIIRAKSGEVPIITRPDAGQNTINIENAEHLVLRGIEVMGGSHAIRLLKSSFITIEECHVHDSGDVAISANIPGSSYEGLRFLRNHIHHTNGTGEGMYLGCNNNGCQMFDSLIEGNYIHHTNSATVSQGDGIEIKEGSYNNIVRDNVIHDTKYPCILTYSVVGNGGPNTLERNVVWGCGDNAIQAASDTIIRNNIILGAGGDGIHSHAHQSAVPGNLQIMHNTILNAGGAGIRISGLVTASVIANNAIYGSGTAIQVAGDLTKLQVAGNIGTGNVSGPSSGFVNSGVLADDFVAANLAGTVPNDVFPKAGSSLVDAGESDHAITDDFNGTLRDGTVDVGAYRFVDSGNAGWPLGEGFKDPTATAGSGGSSGSGGASAGGSDGAGAAGAGTPGPSANGGADDESCGCRTVGQAPSSSRATLLLGALALSLTRRRRRRR